MRLFESATSDPLKDPRSLPVTTMTSSYFGIPYNNGIGDINSNSSVYSQLGNTNGWYGFSPANVSGLINTKQSILSVTGSGRFIGAIGRVMNGYGLVKWIFTVDGVETVITTQASAVESRHAIGDIFESLSGHDGTSVKEPFTVIAKKGNQGQGIRFDKSFKLEMEYGVGTATQAYSSYVFYRYERG